MASSSKRGNEAVQVSSVFTALAALTVLLRLYTRFFLVKCPGIEDYLIATSMVCSIGLTICIGIQVKFGMGQHIWTLGEHEMHNSLKAFWVSLLVYNLSLGLTKLSILLQYRRVFHTKQFRIACWSVLTIVLLYTIVTVLMSIFICVPSRAFWTHEQPSKCLNQFVSWFTHAGMNILTDLLIIILPMPVIRNLNLARRQKQALIVIFAVGGFVCVVSILRLQSLVAISNSEDPTYDNPAAATWSSVECNVGIICSCLPCLRPLMACCLPGLFSSTKSNGNSALPRSAYARHHYGPDTMLSPMRSKRSRGSCDVEDAQHGERDGIQVVTEVHVKVEKEEDHASGGNKHENRVRIERGSSTESLVGSPELRV